MRVCTLYKIATRSMSQERAQADVSFTKKMATIPINTVPKAYEYAISDTGAGNRRNTGT
jgi:hypothetical protein